MEITNPAVVSQTLLTPADLAEVGDNPFFLTKTARKQLLVQMDVMYRRMTDPSIPLGQRLAYMEWLSKVGDALPKANTAILPGTGFSVNILMAPQPQTPAIQTTPAVEVVQDVVPKQTAVESPAP